MKKKCHCGNNTLGNSRFCHGCYYEKNPQKYKRKKVNSAIYKRRHPTKTALEQKKTKLKNKYNLTLEEYDRMFEKQDNRCAICGYEQRPEYAGTNKSLCVDHCHSTGKVRGLLCRRCNTGLGYFYDNPELLGNAANFVRSCG